MKKLPLLIHPHPTLRVTCDPVADVTSEIQELVSAMEVVMLENNGIGLAAPQVGVPKRVIIINTKDGILAMVNPRITKTSAAQESGEEGCLSIPEFFGPVTRHTDITVAFLDTQGAEHELHATGLLARVIQHEIDHLNGVLFIDYLDPEDIPKKYRE